MQPAGDADADGLVAIELGGADIDVVAEPSAGGWADGLLPFAQNLSLCGLLEEDVSGLYQDQAKQRADAMVAEKDTPVCSVANRCRTQHAACRAACNLEATLIGTAAR